MEVSTATALKVRLFSKSSSNCNFNSGYERLSGLCIDIDECESDICHSLEKCTNYDGGYDCPCIDGYVRGSEGMCVPHADCESDLCFNPQNECTAGTHNCHDFEDCVNLPEGFECVCSSGFQRVGGVCQNIDECLSNPCTFPNSICHDMIGSYLCECLTGIVMQAQIA